MANKGLEKLKRKIFGNKDMTPEQKHQEDLKKQENLDRIRLQELGFVNLLEEVRVSLMQSSKLPEETVREAKIDSVLSGAIHHFAENPVIVDHNLSEIDSSIGYIICELDNAIKDGNKTTAYWASISLAAAINYLHIPIRVNDEAYAEALLKERTKYALNLENLVKNCIELDRCENNMTTQLERYEKEEQKLQEKMQQLESLVATLKGKKLVLELQKYANDRSKLSTEARRLNDDLYQANMDKKNLLSIAIVVNTAAADRLHYAAEVNQYRNILSQVPHVVDPELQAKNKAAHEEYLRKIREQLSNAEEGMRVINAYLVEMASLANHSLFVEQTTVALDMVAQMQLRKLREKESELEAANALRRDKEQEALLRRIEKEIAAQIKAMEEELEEETVAEENVQENLEENHEAVEEIQEEEEEELEFEDAE